MGNSIKDQRLAAGLTQQQLAAETPCSVAFVQMVEGGYRPGRSDVLPRLVAVLEAHQNDLNPAANGAQGKAQDRDLLPAS